ncbi:MAG: amino acid adenylation domain-containing protein [Bryobacteraceae bacterium]
MTSDILGFNLPLLDAEERRAALEDQTEIDLHWSASALDQKPIQTIVDLIDRQCEENPAKVAAVFEGEQLTYGELERRANQLAAYLSQRGVGPETLVGLCVDRSLTMLVALVAILKAGGAYVPLDPDFPTERLRFMLQDSGARLVLTERKFIEALSAAELDLVCLDTELEAILRHQEIVTTVAPSGDDLAYVIYTSGSTGRPKGVMIEHSALLNELQSMSEEPGLDRSDVILAIATISFDIAGIELFLPLTVGARVIIASRAIARDPTRLLALLKTSKATVMQATPATWRMLLQSGWTGQTDLKILSGGEKLSRDLADALLERAASVWNVYGPTETTIWSTVGRVEKNSLPVSIGHPVANTQVYILDDTGKPVPSGVAGELYVGGAGLARGYWNQPELTKQRFIENPFGPPGSRLYRTGDEAKFRDDGDIECLGRKDDQVKIRGYRIELGEIEATLRQDAAVKDSAVIARETENGESQLVAFVVPAKPDAVADGHTLRARLQRMLPEYMVPAVFVNVTELPITPTGKIDRRALKAAPGISATNVTELEKFVAPRTELERKLVDIFERLLEVRPVSVTGNFFSLGGHFLLAVRLFSEIANLCGTKLPPSTVFRAPSVELLADILAQEGVGKAWSPLVPIKASGSLPPIFCVHARGSNLVRYHALANLLGPDQPFYGLQSTGIQGKKGGHVRIEDMAAEYIEAIRTIQPEGPYNLAGWSFGGTVAFEMAQQLVAKGESVGLVGLIDAFFPGQPAHFIKRTAPGTPLWKFDLYWGELLFAGRGEHRRRVSGVLSNLTLKAKSILRSASKKVKQDLTLTQMLAEIEKANLRAERAYVAKPYPGRVTLFWCSDWSFRVFHDTRLGWSNVAREGLEVHVVPGNHKSMWDMPNAGVFAEKVRRCLQKAQRRTKRWGLRCPLIA